MARPADPNTRIELLRAAEAVFVERGLENAKVEDITRRAGRSKGSFYLHFESKDEAFRQIVETMLARLADIVESNGPPATLRDPDEARAVLDQWLAKDVETFEFLWQNRGVAGLLLGGGGSKDFCYLIDEFAARARAVTERWLRWGIASGAYRADLDVEVVSLVIAGAYDRVARELVQLPKKPDLAAWVASVRAVILRGVASPVLLAVVDREVNEAPSRRRVRR